MAVQVRLYKYVTATADAGTGHVGRLDGSLAEKSIGFK
jgi:hypothetical protein